MNKIAVSTAYSMNIKIKQNSIFFSHHSLALLLLW